MTINEHTPRMNFAKTAPKVFRALIALHTATTEGLDPVLIELVQTRSSQLNHCAYCLDMHIKAARKLGESEDRMHLLSVWEEASAHYTEREQAALALTEAVTLLPNGVSDKVYERAAKHFAEAELAHLIGLIFTINAFNRIHVTTGSIPAGPATRP
ncbi:carboxymuconolactone decarboxylase family protein [Streptomyces sp. H10-C2]|uniref:carboxymuconolactone decarboxylase family protein n=1 Tax=unclassified Streptomyces TaxID=2593676 RepID=UPI0024BB1B3D|nr:MULTISPECIES: carboxymuconolactone decarboxylase family protein [unclassified Streptomyces]MDJ0341825.1 carboxymuconolactone decarboxylase family protein [Streptomyces sp. PH10-H1]MDJ0370421.1 carboxymuconolactone decarboxylase family protein [Streptomyces sp. H10-C2]